jgi:hypothetical protein
MWWRWLRTGWPSSGGASGADSTRTTARLPRCESGREALARRMSRRWTSCPATFELGGRKVSARMCNVSRTGARFRLEGNQSDVRIEAGSPLEITIRTPYGPVTRRGSVKWSHGEDEFRYFGVDFGELPEGDPLAALADSPF